MKKREFLMLAHTFNPKKHRIGGWYASEKLDGMRCFWDGGITRGQLKADVFWANTAKDDRYVETQVSTGLWSRYGNVIHAPDWWLDLLPKIMMDGELYIPGFRQDLMTIVKKLTPGEGWRRVKFYVFGLPGPQLLFKEGRINNPNFVEKILDGTIPDLSGIIKVQDTSIFRTKITLIKKYCDGQVAVPHEQVQLPFQTDTANEMVRKMVESITDKGGEGLVLRKPESWWEPKRSHELLKVKPYDDDEGIVTGYISGRKTDKGSKLLGLMGALILDYNGKRLELSGFTDAEREFDHEATQWSCDHPGQEVPDWVISEHFPRGCSITFRYRGKTRDGIPQEARYWRKRS